MIRWAAPLALVTFVGVPVAWADDEPISATAPQETAAAEQTPANAAGSDEVPLDNAAVNRALAGGDIQPLTVPVRGHRFGVYLGFRAINVTNSGYDPYSEGDALAMSALGFSFSPWRTRPLSLHFAAEWNAGSTNAYTRGADSTLTVNRLALGLEGRWMPKSRFYLYARVMPALLHFGGEIYDWELGAQLESSVWTAALDASAGVALRLGTAGTEPKRTASFWLMIDWGASLARQSTMTFRPEEIEDEPRKFGSIDLPDLRLGGFVTRASFAVSF